MDMRKANVVVVGSINCDIVSYLDSFPKPNETVTARSYEIAIGGKGLNQAVAAARMGANVTMIGCVGDDDFGHKAIAHLEDNNVDHTAIVISPNAPTGAASIAVNAAGDNMISVASGANHALTADHINACRECIEAADVLITQAEVTIEVMSAALEMAHNAGVITVLNPAPATRAVLLLLKHSTYITPNELETQTLSGVYPDESSAIDKALGGLKAHGAQNILITCGARGSLLAVSGRLETIAPFLAESIDSTGAGDVFNGVFAVGLASGEKPAKAACLASAAAAISVTRKTANSAPTYAELMEFVSTHG